MKGWRGRLTSWLVKMLTTDGIALRAAPLNDVTALGAVVSCVGGSLIATTFPRGFQESRSGRSVETTNSAPRQMVAVWQKVSQSLRMLGQVRPVQAGTSASSGPTVGI